MKLKMLGYEIKGRNVNISFDVWDETKGEKNIDIKTFEITALISDVDTPAKLRSYLRAQAQELHSYGKTIAHMDAFVAAGEITI